MALLKLGHIKYNCHLKNSIDYILQEEKTKEESNIISNCGSTAKEILKSFQDTKKLFKKEGGRAAYHFIISFHPDEASSKDCREIAGEFCQEFLGLDYDYVCAVHDDVDHKHAHIIFNSVDRWEGYKYRYERYDWEKKLQPLLNRLCKEHGILQAKWTFEKTKNKKRIKIAEKKVPVKQEDILYHDLDIAIEKARDYSDFLELLRRMGYEVKEGYSKSNQQSYLALKNTEMKRARRTTRLKSGYSLEQIRKRIEEKSFIKKEEATFQQTEEREAFFKSSAAKNIKSFVYKGEARLQHTFIGGYQVSYVKRVYRVSIYRKGEGYFKEPSYRQDIYRFHKLRQKCLFLLQNKIETGEDLYLKIRELKNKSRDEKADQDMIRKQLLLAYQIRREVKRKKALAIQREQVRKQKEENLNKKELKT